MLITEGFLLPIFSPGGLFPQPKEDQSVNLFWLDRYVVTMATLAAMSPSFW